MIVPTAGGYHALATFIRFLATLVALQERSDFTFRAWVFGCRYSRGGHPDDCNLRAYAALTGRRALVQTSGTP
jgi:hypothetical protein